MYAIQPNRSTRLLQPFKHRILGTLSLDSPFLGLHPGIVVSGLSSLFQPTPKSDKDATESSETSLTVDPSTSDLQLPLSDTTSNNATTTSSPPPAQLNELYDPPYFNDLPFREKPLISRLRHFASKHKTEGIFNAIGNHIVSHLEFGGCMADYPELSSRYKRIRALEDVDELKAISEGHPAAAHRRVRFVNYYTLSPGRPKPSPQIDSAGVASLSTSTLGLDEQEADKEQSCAVQDQTDSDFCPGSGKPVSSGRAAVDSIFDGEDLYEADETSPRSDEIPTVENPRESQVMDHDHVSENDGHVSMLHLDPTPIPDEEEEGRVAANEEPHEADVPPAAEIKPSLDLAPIPPDPKEPTPPDLTKYTDKDARKQAEKEAKREQKAYQQAIKDRNKAIREREKLLEKRRRKSEKEAQRLQKQSLREAQEAQKHRDDAEAALGAKHTATESASTSVATASGRNAQDKTPPHPADEQPKKLRKFCSLPRRHNGQRDPTWVDVYMADVDEVGAHCGLFAPGPHYDKLVGDVGSRIMTWVHDDMSTRAAIDMQSS
ncbi:hypothetical protein V2A60_003590 [Cordyceps javanica]